MQNSENHIDGLFRNKLLDHDVVPPPSVWNNIEGSLDGKKRKRRMIVIWGASLAASLLLAFVAGWYFSGQNTPSATLQAINSPSLAAVQSAPITLLNKPENNPVTTTKQSEIAESYTSPKLENTLAAVTSAKTATTKTIDPSRESFFMRLLSPLKVHLKNNQNGPAELIAMNNAEVFTEADRAIMARNLQAQKMHEKKSNKVNSGFAVGVEASPVYRFEGNSSQSTDYTNTIASSGTREYKTNFAGGVVVTYKTSKKLSFQSGVGYDEISQDGGQVGVTYTGHNWISDGYTENNFLGITKTPSSGEASNNVILNTNMGLANISLPNGTEVASANTSSKVTNQETLNYDFQQHNGYIQVPFIVRYKIIDQRLGLHLLGGINTNVLVSNEASLSNNNQVIANGKTEGLNQFTFTSSLGVGMSYAISQRFNLSIEPTMKFQLNSLNSQQYYDTRPYAVGIYTGISYQF